MFSQPIPFPQCGAPLGNALLMLYGSPLMEARSRNKTAYNVKLVALGRYYEPFPRNLYVDTVILLSRRAFISETY